MAGTEFLLKRLTNGQIMLEMEGTEAEVAEMICDAMSGNIHIASMICGAIPTFLDLKGIDRAGYCKTVMDAVGFKNINDEKN